MSTIRTGSYKISVGKGSLSDLNQILIKKNYSSLFIICDDNTIRDCLPYLILSCPTLAQASIIELESGEASKSIEICTNIWKTLSEAGADRKAAIINLGGGVVSDVGGFCASVYKRGIHFLNVPTSMLAMVDASVGGKTGINLQNIKNLIGTITQPSGVFIDPYFLKTLPQRHFQNGLAETYKMALVADKAFWKTLTKEKRSGVLSLISQSVKIKNRIVLQDLYDTGKRKALNFGHTIGHAIESASLISGNDLLHGEAVVSGMIIESHIAWQKKLISRSQLNEISEILVAKFNPARITIPFNDLKTFLNNDKKSLGGRALFALLHGIGKCKTDVPATEAQIKKGIEFFNSAVT